MQFEDPRTILEAAAAKPSRPLNPQALVGEARRLRRLRFAAAATAVLVLGAGTSAALTLRSDERGPGPAGVASAWCRDEEGSAAVLLRPGASEDASEEVEREIEAIPGVEIVDFVSRAEVLEFAEEVYGEWGASEASDSLAANFRVRVADETALDLLTDLEGPAVFRVVGNPTTDDPQCILDRACNAAPPTKASVFLRNRATRADALALRQVVWARPGIESVQYMSQREAYEEFKGLYPGQRHLYETISPRNLPASLRVEGTPRAIERLSWLASPFIDEVRRAGSFVGNLCEDGTPAPVAEEATPSPEEEESEPVDLVPDIQPDVLGAECGIGPLHVSRTQLLDSPGSKWCRFDVVVSNAGTEAAVFRYGDVMLHTAVTPIEPWMPDLQRPSSSGSLFGEPLAPGRTAMGQITFELMHDHVPTKLELWESPKNLPIVFLLHYERCLTNLRDDADGRCAFEATLQESAPYDKKGRVHVLLYHCGVEPVVFAGREWVVPNPPFDATNAPGDFAGTGRMKMRSETVAVYVDRSGARIRFRALQGWQPPPCA